jgi:hypothetical protein
MAGLTFVHLTFLKNKFMKLELKHLAPYLPYGLKVQSSKTETLSGLLEDKIFVKEFNLAYPFCNCIPILRPISDLDSLIETCFKNISFATKEQQFLIDLFCYENISTEECLSDLDLTKLPYECVNYIFKNHYDFFDLIPQGLAINFKVLKIKK